MALTVAAFGAVIGFITFIASMMSRVSPAFTAWPTVTNGFAPGSGERKAVPDHRRLQRLAAEILHWRGSRRGRRGGRRCRSGHGNRRRRDECRRRIPADLDLTISVLNLDFVQIIVAQQLSELTHEGGIDTHRRAFVGATLAGLGHSDSPSHAHTGTSRRVLPPEAAASSGSEPRCNCVEGGTYLSGLSQMTIDHTIQVRINGEHRRVAEGITIAELVSELGFDPARVAVERNVEVVPRSTIADVKVQDGDDFEIVRFVGGG